MREVDSSEVWGIELVPCQSLTRVSFDHLTDVGYEALEVLPLKLPKNGVYLVRSTPSEIHIYEQTEGIKYYQYPRSACEGEPEDLETEVRIVPTSGYCVPLLVLHKETAPEVPNVLSLAQARAASEARAMQVRAAISHASESPGAAKISRE